MDATELRALELISLRREVERREAETELRSAAAQSRKVEGRIALQLSEFDKIYKAISNPDGSALKKTDSRDKGNLSGPKLKQEIYRSLLAKRTQIARIKEELKSKKSAEQILVAKVIKLRKVSEKLGREIEKVAVRSAVRQRSLSQEEIESRYSVELLKHSKVDQSRAIQSSDRSEWAKEKEQDTVELAPIEEVRPLSFQEQFQDQLSPTYTQPHGSFEQQNRPQPDSRAIDDLSNRRTYFTTARGIAEKLSEIINRSSRGEVGIGFNFLAPSGNSYAVQVKTMEHRSVLLVQIGINSRISKTVIGEIKAELTQAFRQAGINVKSIQFQANRGLIRDSGENPWRR